MRTKLILFITVALIGSLSCRAQEANLDDILSAYYKANGIDKVKDWQTIICSGKTIAQGTEFPFTYFLKRPGKIRTEAEVQGNKMISAFDGTNGWSVVPWSGSSDPQDMTTDEIKGMKEQTDPEGGLYNWKEKGHKAELLGKEDLDGTPAYKIKLTLADGNVETWFIDAETYIPLKMVSVAKIQGNDVESELYYSNYADFHGAMMAKTMTNKYKGQTVSQIEIEKLDINLPVSDSLFLKPVKK
ncbi:MAG: outer membrane lipoprotein-sorting protein [Bacteroidales bacterium]|jgi:outer membrane lipoprotein-sorting protein